MKTLLSKTYTIQPLVTNQTTQIEALARAIEKQAKEDASRVKHGADSCDYCGRLAKRVKGIAVCPTCSGGW